MKGGVIIIGSLFWDDHRNENDSLRKNWRKNRLDIKNAFRVKLPIRYGRKSKGGEFTMVFSTRLERSSNLGIGYVIPFISNPITNYEQLENEVLEIAKAEALGTIENPSFFTSWGGSLGLLFNKEKVNEVQQNSFYREWKMRYYSDKQGNSDANFSVNGERKSIKDGKLQINWPVCVDIRDQYKLDNLEFLVGASNKPRYSNRDGQEVYKYPKIEEIALANSKDKKRYYFLRNIESGILTFQDLRILNKMK